MLGIRGIRKIITAARDAVGETLYPTRCVGCDAPGYLVCPNCDRALERINPNNACKRCGAAYGALVCTECAAPGPLDASGSVVEPPFVFDAARCACSYEGIAASTVRAYKDGDEQRLTPYLAREMLRAARGKSSPWERKVAGSAVEREATGLPQPEPPTADWTRIAGGVVPVPPTGSHTRERGWEHLQPLAQLIARGAGLPLVCALQSAKAADQRRLGREERAANRRSSVSLLPGAGPLPRTVLLVDDVLTTGATCDACAAVLKNAGVRQVLVLTFARVW